MQMQRNAFAFPPPPLQMSLPGLLVLFGSSFSNKPDGLFSRFTKQCTTIIPGIIFCKFLFATGGNLMQDIETGREWPQLWENRLDRFNFEIPSLLPNRLCLHNCESKIGGNLQLDDLLKTFKILMINSPLTL